ncbi:MAG TPA: hypothetical protein DDY91_21620 [Planctomycetaceae bacterium]|nr:hypothetical protein [Planctomycetaceae bacterium]
MNSAAISSCPTPTVLRRILDGEIDAGVEDHIQRCAACSRVLEVLAAENALPLPRRQPAPSFPEPTGDFFVRLASRIPCPPPPTFETAVPPQPPEIPGFFQWELVGRGGMGEVYRAWQPELSRWVALKTLRPGWGEAMGPRVQREARILGRLQHPHIVRIHDTGEHHGQPYLVMEWIQGGSLEDRLRQGPLSIREAVRVVRQIASALEAVHLLGIIHRDLKPANVLLQPAADSADQTTADTAMLTDFSIAFDTESANRLTMTGLIMGTPHYMAPEQTGLAPHLGDVGPATDLYGVGAVLYACLTGQSPHTGESTLATLQRVATEEPRPPRELCPAIPTDLETIVLKCLRGNPALRYASVSEFADDLDRFLDGRPILARPYPLHERVWQWVRRKPVVAVILALAVPLTTAWLAGRHDHQRQIQQLTGELEVQTNQAWLAQWQALQQLTQNSAIQFERSREEPDQRRLLVNTLSDRYRDFLSNLPNVDGSIRTEVAGGLDRLTDLEEQEQLWELLLADGQLNEPLASRFPESPPLQILQARIEARRRRALVGLDRLTEATELTEILLDNLPQNASTDLVSAVLLAVDQQAEALYRSQAHDSAGQLRQRGIDRLVADTCREPLNPMFWKMRLTMHFHQLQMHAQMPGTGVSRDDLESWGQTLRDCLERLPQSTPTDRHERAKLLQRWVEQVLQLSPALAETLFALWQQEVDSLDATPLENELAVMRVYLLALQFRAANSGGTIEPPTTAAWFLALRRASLAIGGQTDDFQSRWDLGWILVQNARQQFDARNPQVALESARLASLALSPLVGATESLPGSRALLADAHYIASEVHRSEGQLSHCRDELERAYMLSVAGNRDTIAVELVRTNLELSDRGRAEQYLGWIAGNGPQRQAALQMLGRSETAQGPTAAPPRAE